ncbi:MULTISPECIES: sensor histidine kinase [Micromonospora]|uniref:histidine kinase n=1 Tax=Micromonospora yangpuensis TaxID=683228 RepID=A0A1C6UUI4_9ACTN|nr:HAMP domain-containing sensor histidine kinase [Micromonospora yangpuensis]GGM24165.1 two-component sensor histidine kinase [Micromonospora yangpuensis]SCL57651.1 Signal transduction histidine kinase [Micromonospora yangpuensis]
MTRRLLLTYLTLALLILVALEVPLGYVYHRSEQQHAFGQLEHDAEVLAAFIDTALRDGDLPRADLLARESAQRLGGHVDIVDARGELLTSTHSWKHPPGSLAAAPDLRTVLDGSGLISTRTAEYGGERIMSVAVPVHPGDAGQGAIRVSVPIAPMENRIHQFWIILAAAGVAVLAMVALVAFALARWISRPVRELERATRRLADGTLPLVSTDTGPPELRRLAATFHTTASRLQNLIATQRSFVGDASHQLKTPLAALRLRLENLEPDVAPSGTRNLRAALAETDRLARLVGTLLAIARSEQTCPVRETVDLPTAVADRIFLWTPLAAEQDVQLVATGPDRTPVRAVAGAVDQILDNLLSNALRVAPPGSAVRISWLVPPADRPGPGLVELHVVDAGPGLTAEQRSRALDPFWRAPDAAKGGTGLGLSLVRRLAEASDGTARLAQAPGRGIDAVITLPVARPAPADDPAPARGLPVASGTR